jgi:hypothetical protein
MQFPKAVGGNYLLNSYYSCSLIYWNSFLFLKGILIRKRFFLINLLFFLEYIYIKWRSFFNFVQL